MIRILLISLSACLASPLWGAGGLSLTYQSHALDTTIYVWRGERAGVGVLVEADATVTLRPEIQGPKALTRGSQAAFVGRVLTTAWRTCGYPPADLPAYTVPDRIDLPQAETLHEGERRLVWCTIEVPRRITAGAYTLRLMGSLPLRVVVLDRTLPRPAEQAFHLDLWQQPYSVARYYGVKPWSRQHLDLLRPYLQLLARAGQKVVTTILFYEPWGEQSNDKFLPMIETTLRRDGTWAYDYTAFDAYVSLAHECGIREQINCYSMVPWDMTFRYYDERQQRYVDLRCDTSSPEYRRLWKPFLQAFAQHLKRRGWYDRTCIAMDERGLDLMRDAYRIAQEAVPGIRMALAGGYHAELDTLLYDYCLPYAAPAKTEPKSPHRIRTLYTCCTEPRPNLFTNNAPTDAAFLPLYCVARGYDGYLHWSWLNWTDHPMTDTRFRMFAPGDTYMVYPGPRSSLRFEHLIEGIQLSEKIRLMRGDPRLEAILPRLAETPPTDEETAALVSDLKRIVSQP